MSIQPLVICLFLLFGSTSAMAKKNKPQNQSQRTTEAHFTGATVSGKYVHSPEATVAIEKEKNLISVVKPRSNFKFQIQQSREELR